MRTAKMLTRAAERGAPAAEISDAIVAVLDGPVGQGGGLHLGPALGRDDLPRVHGHRETIDRRGAQGAGAGALGHEQVADPRSHIRLEDPRGGAVAVGAHLDDGAELGRRGRGRRRLGGLGAHGGGHKGRREHERGGDAPGHRRPVPRASSM